MANTLLPVAVPLLNPNEPEALLASLYISEGQAVKAGEILASLETTKSAGEINAPAQGYIVGLNGSPGQTLRAGQVLCSIAPTPDWQPLEPAPGVPASASAAALPDGLRITQPALALAHQSNLDLTSLPRGPLVTENLVRQFLQQPAAGPNLTPPAAAWDPSAIVVYGGGGHGKSLIDLLRVLGVYRITGVIDDGMEAGRRVLDVPVLGGSQVLARLYAEGVRLAVNAVGGIGAVAVRLRVFHLLAQAGFTCPAVVHPTAFVEPSARLSAGVQIFPHAYVGSDAAIGYGTIVNTAAIVSHDCQLGDYVNISPGAMLAGNVQVGSGALVGMGATLNLEVHIGPLARIGNGATVKADVPEHGVVRAGSIWPE